MFKKNLIVVFNFVICICFLCIITFLSGCGQVVYGRLPFTGDKDYQTFRTPQEDKFSVSFEYPARYQLGYEPQYSETIIHLESNPSADTHRITRFFIRGALLGQGGFHEAKDTMQQAISNLRGKWYRNYRLETKHQIVTTDSLEGWEIVVSYRERPESFRPGFNPIPPEFVVVREVFFDYQGTTWLIFLSTDATSYKQASSDFDHILKTFSILK
jgi:hypothetical protein